LIKITYREELMARKLLALAIGFLLMGSNGLAADGDLIVNGNLGVGTTGPEYRLDVAGRIRSQHTIMGADTGYEWWTGPYTDASAWQITRRRISDGAYSNALTLLVGGNVGIGTTGPEYKLDVAGRIRSQHTIMGADTGYEWWTGPYTDASAWQITRRRISDGNYATALTALVGGNVGIGTTNPGTYKLYVNGPAYSTGGWETSDFDLKENIASINSPLSKVLNMEGVSFNWRTEKDKLGNFFEGRRFGVIAQKLEGILPEAVKEGPEGKKAVAYTQIIPVLIEAIKEQQKQIEALKSEVAAMKGQK
jgi:hypothetical protein